MGNTVVIGRLTNLVELTHYAAGFGIAGEHDIFCRYSNYPLESFLEYLEHIERIESSQCFHIANIDSFLLECDKKMPRIFSEMDDLDHYCASKVLDDLPGVLISLKKSVNQDILQKRQSHYFIKFENNT